jgi:hypothetical protein
VPDYLRTTLLDLLYELQKTDLRLMLGGGYGLFLKQEHLASSRATTLIPPDAWPEARATNDLDLLLRPEIVTSSENMGIIRDTLRRLGFEPVEGAEYYQFAKPLGGSRSVKLDFLAGPLGEHHDRSRVKVDARRIRPKPSAGLHAHRTDEAVAYDPNTVEVPLSGSRSNGEAFSCNVELPQSFSYLIMKLFAFRDRREDQDKEFARHHALDLYRIVAMLTESEYETVEQLAARFQGNDQVREACTIVSDFFNEPLAVGILRMREHALFTENLDVRQFIEVLSEFFPQ